MLHTAALLEIDGRIAAIREKILSVSDQASAIHGASNESRPSDRIAELEEMLSVLIKEREALE